MSARRKEREMKSSEGRMERVFSITFEHGDILKDRLIEFVKMEDVQNGYIFFLGALEKAELVTGPRDLTLPASPMWSSFADGREVLGMGSIAWEGRTPHVHLHTCAGRGGDLLVGCLREGGIVHIVVEAVLFEVSVKWVTRKYDEQLGAWLPKHR
jgi:uncharacterized protein